MVEEKPHGSEKCGSREKNGLHRGGRCGLYVFVVHVMEANVVYANHKRHMVDPWVVHVNQIIHMNHNMVHHVNQKKHINHKWVHHVFFVVHVNHKNTWWTILWFM